MRIYLRKVFHHDTTHEVSVRSDIVAEFFGGRTSGILFRRKDNPVSRYSVDINSATDPRFGGEFKGLLRDLGNINTDDIISIRKFDEGYFDLEIIRPTDDRYQTYFRLFPNGRSSDGRDRHQILNVDENMVEDEEEYTGADNILLYGVPGCGKSHEIKTNYCDNDEYMERAVFHPDYTYSDFVGQILPKVNEGRVSYEFEPGPFTRILKKATENEGFFYLIIEEINRGNAPAIFGDIFQLLDRDDNGKSEYGISNESIAEYVYGDKEKKVKIPENLYILATMNTSDQNVFTLDTAFKRRWTMKHIKNNIDACKFASHSVCNNDISWSVFANTINEKIIEVNNENLSNEDNRLGAYFVKVKELEDANLFGEKVLMYLWNDAFRYDHEKVFHSDYRTLDELIDGFRRVGLGIFVREIFGATDSSDDVVETELDETEQ